MGSPHPHPQLRELSMSAIAIRDEASLNVVIPMGGSAEAFREAGYVFPKPLIKIAGRPMLMHLLDNLRLRTGDVVWLVVPHDLHAQHDAEFDLVGRQYSGADIRTVVFKMQTRGAVETIFIGLQNMTPAELARKTICLDCDNLYFSDVLGDFRTLPKGQGACFYFIDTGTAALYSYLQTQSHGKDQVVIHVAEKVAISDRANCGAYGFASGSLLHKFSQAVLDAPHRDAMQYYLSSIITKMLAQGHRFLGLPAYETKMCGTPTKLQEFIATVAAGKALVEPKRRFCFALDNVLVTYPQVPGDFSTVKPIERNIQLVRELKASGHYIIISTSRLMLEKQGNVGAVIAACGNSTLKSMEDLKIPYDEIHFGQPNADLYIDRAVACASVDTEKDIGWRLSQRPEQGDNGMVAARHFNEVQLQGGYVIKTAATSVLRGEIFFYQHCPPDIADIFPALVSCSTGGGDGDAPVREGAAAPPETNAGSCAAGDATASSHGEAGLVDPTRSSGPISSMTLQRINGVTFSHLVTSRCLTPGRLKLFLKALRRVHSSSGDPATLIPRDSVDLGQNYLPKLRKRYAVHQALYSSLCPDAPAMFERICLELERYMAEGRYQHANVIHGDPVFSNVLLTDTPGVYLLDMRGEVGTRLTLQGDVLYDLSKVYQSLLGYDFIILNQPMRERDAELLEELRDVFCTFIADEYPDVAIHDVVKLAASHYFGIVPLHNNRKHQLAYLDTCRALLSSIPPSV